MTERKQLIIAAALTGFVLAVGASQAFSQRDAGDLFRRAEGLYVDRRYEEALGLLQTFPRNDPLAAEADFLAGKARYRLKQFSEAETCFRRAAAARPGSARFRMNLALSLYDQGRKEEAAECYQSVIKTSAASDPDLAERAAIARRAALGGRSRM